MRNRELSRIAAALEAALTPEEVENRLQRLRRLHQFADSLREIRRYRESRDLGKKGDDESVRQHER